MKRFKIAIIGVGEIGSRHLQGLAKIKDEGSYNLEKCNISEIIVFEVSGDSN
jgi:homoserine dehydrogenase